MAEFLPDSRLISQGVVVNSPGWEDQLEQNKQAFTDAWVSRTEFKAAYDAVTDAQYVDTLFANAGVTPDQAERDALVGGLDGGTETRATALRKVAESRAVSEKEFDPAFVLMQYYGYLRRDPDASPDNNLSGYNFWLNKLNSFSQPGEDMRDDSQAFTRVQKAEMVRAFIESAEYRQRFGGAPGGNQSGAPVQGGALKGNNWKDGLARAAPFLFDPTFTRLWFPG